MTDLADLLRRALPHVSDAALSRQIEAALRREDNDSGRVVPPWLDVMDGVDLRMLSYEDASAKSLRGFDPATVLTEVRQRIDTYSRDPDHRADFPVEQWLQSLIAQEPESRPRKRKAQRPVEVAPGTVSEQVAKFAAAVTEMLNIKPAKQFSKRLAQLIAEHDLRADPTGRHTLRRIADAMENLDYELSGPISQVLSPDDAPMTYIPLGSVDTGTLMYDPELGQFTVNSPKNWSEGYAVEFVVSP